VRHRISVHAAPRLSIYTSIYPSMLPFFLPFLDRITPNLFVDVLLYLPKTFGVTIRTFSIKIGLPALFTASCVSSVSFCR
jgi:hypothetical protein